MTEKEQIAALEDDLNKLIYRYCHEFCITRASAVGVLMCCVHQIIRDGIEDNDEEEP